MGVDSILASELFGRLWYGEDKEIKGITCNSQRIKNGYIFVCLKGEKDNGYKYVNDAVKNGAVAVIAQSFVHCVVPVILVDEPRIEMARLSKKIYECIDEKMSVVAVTGTNGKTSVSHIIRDVLNSLDINTALIGTNGVYYNNKYENESFTTQTTPEASELWKILKKMHEKGAKTALLEASSHALYSNRLYGLKVDVGIFTNLTSEHLDFHKDMESYKKAKEILLKMSRVCVINTDNRYGRELYEKYKNKSISIGLKDADVTAQDISYLENKTQFTINDNGEKMSAVVCQTGEFSVYNSLCAYAALKVLGINNQDIIKGFLCVKQVKGRAEILPLDTPYKVIIDYAHTPDGLKNIIRAVKNITKGRVITVFGCGGERDRSKRSIMGEISAEMSDFTVITSDNPRGEEPEKIIDDIVKGISKLTNNYVCITDRKDAIIYALNIARENDSVLLAGKGHENYIIENNAKIYFDEREIIKNHIERNEHNDKDYSRGNL